jgi:F420-dependent oxidoreductase-like protein
MAGTTWQQYSEVWKIADEVGYSTAFIPDHFYSGSKNPEAECYEAWSVVSAMAAATKRLRIGPLVLGNTYRHPAVVANMAATLDHISGGRLNLGLGAGWMQVEHDGYGIPLPPPRERLDRLDEALQVIKLLFSKRRATFHGQFYQLNDALCEPKPLQKPYPHLIVGGSGEKRTLRIAAKHADEWNGEVGPVGMGRKIAILHEHCRAVGRDPSEIEISVLIRPESAFPMLYAAAVRDGNTNIEQERQRLIAVGVSAADLDDRLRESVRAWYLPDDESAAVDRLHEYAAVGVSHVIVSRQPPFDLRAIERFMTHIAPRVVK